MSSNPRTPLGPTATEVLECLEASMDETDGMTVDEAITCLVAAEFEEPTARDALEQLQLKGYLYEVNGRLYITPT